MRRCKGRRGESKGKMRRGRENEKEGESFRMNAGGKDEWRKKKRNG